MGRLRVDSRREDRSTLQTGHEQTGARGYDRSAPPRSSVPGVSDLQRRRVP